MTRRIGSDPGSRRALKYLERRKLLLQLQEHSLGYAQDVNGRSIQPRRADGTEKKAFPKHTRDTAHSARSTRD